MFMYQQSGEARDWEEAFIILYNKNYKDFEYYEQNYTKTRSNFMDEERIANGLRQVREMEAEVRDRSKN